jgi:hypothetical protein
MRARALLLPLLLVTLSIHAGELTTDDLKRKPYVVQQPMPRELRLGLIDLCEGPAIKYLAAIESVSFKSFEGLDIDAPVVHSLTLEAEDIKALMRGIIANLKVLRAQPEDAKRWMLLVRDYYAIEGYIEDLERFRIVRSSDYMGLKMMMPFVFDGILLPAIASR